MEAAVMLAFAALLFGGIWMLTVMLFRHPTRHRGAHG